MPLLANEEDVKIKRVVPILQSLGFDCTELFYEKSFLVQVGRSPVSINTEEQLRSMYPRLDILVKRDGKNLFIVEVKGPTITIGQDEVDQAVCYARLVHPVAPFCLITNGQDWKLINTLTKEEVTDKIDPNQEFKVVLPDEDVRSAIKYFLGYSRENMIAFCRAQVTVHMRELLGGTDDRDKKYIPELYQERDQLAQATQTFLQAASSCFSVVGDSGSGKTCWACHEALRTLEQGSVALFYRGFDVAGDILEAISNDLNWAFSPYYDEVQAVKRLLELFQQERITIWIDGIDSLPLASARRILTEFLRRTEGHAVKLLLTCNAETWSYLLEEDGIPTLLATRVFQVNGVKGYQLGPVEEQELLRMIEKYRAFYHYSGSIDREIFETCRRIPFLFRVLFEVASELSLPYLGYSVADVFDRYFSKLCNRFDEQKDMIRRLLAKIAQHLYEQNSDEVEEDDLLESLDIGFRETLPERLFTLSILERTYRERTTFIGFYFKKLRDYLIAFHALKWPRKSLQDFQHIAAQPGRRGVHLDVLNLYYSLTPVEPHQRVLDHQLYVNASAFVSLYENILNTDFPAFKRSFSPHTSGPIGFVGYADFSRNAISLHGFRPLQENEKVLLIPTVPIPGDWQIDNKGYVVGLRHMHSTDSSRGFQDMDVAQEVLSKNVHPSLKAILQEGRLDESQNRTLLIERVVATCLLDDQAGFRKLQGESSSLFPLPLQKVKEFLLFKIAYDLLDHQLRDRHITSGNAVVSQHGSCVGYSIPVIPEEQAEIEKQAWALAREGKNVAGERNYQRAEDRESLLLEDVKCLEKLGVSEIAHSPLIEWYAEGNRRRSALAQDASYRNALESLLEETFRTFLSEYRVLVERNFPTLSQHFATYQAMPLTLFWAFEEVHQTPAILPRTLLLQRVRGSSRAENTVVHCDRQTIEQNAQELRADLVVQEAYTSMTLGSVLLSGNSYMPLKIGNSSPYILRKLVYQHIVFDVKKVWPFLASNYTSALPHEQ
jgi:hypothetical protein